MGFKRAKKYNGGRHIEVPENGNPENAMKRLQRWMKEENYFIDMREREAFCKKSERKRKAKHLAKKRQDKKWDELGKAGPCKYKRVRNKSNRGKKTTRTDVKKPG